jgi:hypothetical protein
MWQYAAYAIEKATNEKTFLDLAVMLNRPTSWAIELNKAGLTMNKRTLETTCRWEMDVDWVEEAMRVMKER